MAHVTSRESAMVFEELGGMPPSVSPLDRLPQTLSARLAAHREGWEGDVRARETVPEAAGVLAVSLDGVMAPMAKAAPDQGVQTAQTEPEAPAAGDAPGKRHAREAGCGTVTLYDAEGKRLSTGRYGRRPEETNATLCAQLDAACQRIVALRPDLQVVKLADGAEEHGRFLDQLDLGLRVAEQAQVAPGSITDFSHGADHVQQACEVIWGAGSVDSQAAFARLRTRRKEDAPGVDKLIGRLR